MEPQNLNTEEQKDKVESNDQGSGLNKVTPLSKYLALGLFVTLPFIGGWIGYNYAPEKVVEVEKYIVTQNEMDNKSNTPESASETISEWKVIKCNPKMLVFQSRAYSCTNDMTALDIEREDKAIAILESSFVPQSKFTDDIEFYVTPYREFFYSPEYEYDQKMIKSLVISSERYQLIFVNKSPDSNTGTYVVVDTEEPSVITAFESFNKEYWLDDFDYYLNNSLPTFLDRLILTEYNRWEEPNSIVTMYQYIYGTREPVPIQDSELQFPLHYWQALGPYRYQRMNVISSSTKSMTLGVYDFQNIAADGMVREYTQVGTKTLFLE